MGSPKPSGIIKPNGPSPLAKNVDGKWLQANGKNMRGNPLIVPSCEKCIKDPRCVLHRTDHHALWSTTTTKTTPKTTRGHSPTSHPRGCGCRCPHEKEEKKESGQDQCSQSTTGPTTGPADVETRKGMGFLSSMHAIKETLVGHTIPIKDGPWTQRSPTSLCPSKTTPTTWFATRR